MTPNVSLQDHFSSLVSSVYGLLKHPETIAGNLLESFLEWRKSRNWWLLLLGVPFLLAALGFLGTTIFHYSQSKSEIVLNCQREADKRIPLAELEKLAFDEHYIRNKIRERPDPNLMLGEGEDEGFGLARSELKANAELARSEKFRGISVLLRKAIHANPQSDDIKYRLALLSSIDLTLEDPEGTANQLMQELSEDESDINPQTHAWLAAKILGDFQAGTPPDMQVLERHLRIASRWRNVEPELLRYYSEVCLKNGKMETALAIAKQAAESRPELNLVYSKLCKFMGESHELEMLRAAKAAEEAYQTKRGTSVESDMDRLALAEALIIQDRRDVAIEVLKERLDDEQEEHPRVRHGLASIYLEMFNEVNLEVLKKIRRRVGEPQNPLAAQSEPKGSDTGKEATSPDQSEQSNEIDWTFLQEAAMLDEENPMVGQAIAYQLRWHTQKPPTDLMSVLADQLASDIAPTEARLAIADVYLLNNRIAEARQQWEFILAKDPNSVKALNNLSLFLARETPPQLTRALELIERAIGIEPMNPEICDTYGEILMAAGQYVDAVAQLEKAIRMDAMRINSRKRLAECYVRLGMTEMAFEQQNKIRVLDEELKNAQDAAATPPSPQ
jgi:tetratricopeptide (TPR) repeat protein